MNRLFLGFSIIIYSGLCTYTGIRLLGFVRFIMPGMKAAFFWPLYIFLCYVFVITGFMRLGRLQFPRQMGIYWMAIFFYLLVSLFTFDIVRLVLRLFAKNFLTPRFNFFGTAAAICLCVFVIFFGALYARSLRTVHYNLTLKGKGKAFRIALISDTHFGPTVNSVWTAKIADAVNRAKPDMVCMAGDIFDGNIDSITSMLPFIEELKRINAPLGIYACLGNHDVDRFRFSGDKHMLTRGNERITEALREANVVVLEDEVISAGDVYVAGRRDIRPIGMKAARKSAEELLADYTGRPVIVLDHQPMEFTKLNKAGAALMLSGHTHRGQIFPANLLTRAIFKKAGASHYGYFRSAVRNDIDGNSLQAVITSGAGIWGPPLRVGTSSEVAVIDITFTPADDNE